MKQSPLDWNLLLLFIRIETDLGLPLHGVALFEFRFSFHFLIYCLVLKNKNPSKGWILIGASIFGCSDWTLFNPVHVVSGYRPHPYNKSTIHIYFTFRIYNQEENEEVIAYGTIARLLEHCINLFGRNWAGLEKTTQSHLNFSLLNFFFREIIIFQCKTHKNNLKYIWNI